MVKIEKKKKSWTLEEVRQFLIQQGIRPSIYRLKIFHYLINKRTHPTAEEIFFHLKKEAPSISRATVYNSLNLFLAKRIVQLINIRKNEARVDATLSWHGHFKCLSCGKILDFHLRKLKLNGLEGFEIQGKQISLEGKCPQCQKKDIKEV